MNRSISGREYVTVSRGRVMDVKPRTSRPRHNLSTNSVAGDTVPSTSMGQTTQNFSHTHTANQDIDMTPTMQSSVDIGSHNREESQKSLSPEVIQQLGEKEPNTSEESSLIPVQEPVPVEDVSVHSKSEQQVQPETEQKLKDISSIQKISGSNNSKKNPLLPIAFAVIVTLSLSGLAIYGYLQTQKKDLSSTNKVPVTSTKSEAISNPNQEIEKEIDETSSEIESVIKSNDEAEAIPESVLNEKSVGL